jgi:N-acetylneuraminic acid mutarotase
MSEDLGRISFAAGVADNKVYVFGGYVRGANEERRATSILAFDITTNTWTKKNATFAGEQTNGAARIGSLLYISGKDDFFTGELSSAVFAYNPTTDRLIKKANMPRRSGRGISAAIDGKLYVLPSVCMAGGVRSSCRYFYRYDPATNAWTTLAKVPTNHYPQPFGGVINGRLYVVGGGSNPTNRKRLDVYNPATNTWTQRASAPTPSISTGGVLGGKLYIVVVAGSFLDTYAYDPLTNTWGIKARYPAASHLQPSVALQVTLGTTPRLLAIGGLFDKPEGGLGPAPSQMFTP